MKALSMHQPWAQMILDGVKTIETRKWSTNYRGEILICASKQFDFAIPLSTQRILHDEKNHYNISFLFPIGVTLCIADLVDCRKMTHEDETEACIEVYPKAHSLILQNVRRVRQLELPKEIKWRLGLFPVPDEFVKQLL